METRHSAIVERQHQAEFKAFRRNHVASERREVLYGRLRSQSEGWREQFKKVQEVAEVRKPGGINLNEKAWATMSAGLLTAAFQTNETRNSSLLNHLEAALNAQVAALESELAVMEGESAALEAARPQCGKLGVAAGSEGGGAGGEVGEGSLCSGGTAEGGAEETVAEREEREEEERMASMELQLARCDKELGKLQGPMSRFFELADGGVTLNETVSWPHTVGPGLEALHTLLDSSWRRAQELHAQRKGHDAAVAEKEAAEGAPKAASTGRCHPVVERWVERRSDITLDEKAQKELVDHIKRAVVKLSVHRTEEDDFEEEESGFDPSSPLPRGAFLPSKSTKSMFIGQAASPAQAACC